MHRLALLSTAAFFDAVFEDLARAQREICVECYIVLDDELGCALADAMAAAAARGVTTRLLYDPLGSKEASRRFFRDLRGRGVEVRAWRRILTVPGIRHLAPRDHSRVIVIDGVAYTGGAAFARQWLPRERGGEGWQDACIRMEGPAVGDLRDLFLRRWNESHSARAAEDLDTQGRYADLRLIADTPDRHSPLFTAHCELFASARQRIWLANAYFAPPPRMVRVLTDAARRGVDVRVMVPAVSDLALLKFAALARARRWLEAGIRLFEYRDAMMHSKYGVVDHDVCSVGTFNYNSTSVGLANEVNVLVSDRTFVDAGAARFEEDLSRCGEVTLRSMSRRSRLGRAIDAVAHGLLAGADLAWGPR